MEHLDLTSNAKPASNFEDQDSSEPAITDNAKRSVSIRINTSDYGKIKTIARRLRVKESAVFRFLLRDGLNSISTLYQAEITFGGFIEAFFANPEAFLDHFNFDQKRLAAVIKGIPDNVLDDEDIELLCMVSRPRRYLAKRISAKLGANVEDMQSIAMLKEYVFAKYEQSFAQI
ncbi:MAG: hypothetical protein AAF387_13650 [Pseudomonadota bacterium]